MTKRIKVIQGGTSAGKTFGIIPILINQAIENPNQEISIVAESIPHLRRGAMKDFIKIMKETNRWNPQNFNKTHLKYVFKNGSYIEFFSALDESSMRGARRNILYMNEANLINFESYYQLAMRTSGDIYIDFNPTSKFWAHEEVLGGDEAELIILTYKDNEGLHPNTVNMLEANRVKALTSEYWKNWCNVYLDGQLGMLEGVIFSNWSEISIIPDEAKLLGHAIDYGYTNDPTTCIALYKYNDEIILDEVIYRKGLLNSDISKLLKENNVFGEIYADSAEPKSIEELKRYGHSIFPCTKGADSIIYGINLLQEYKMLVTKRSYNLKDELNKYSWKKDREGNQLNYPQDAYNHCFIGDTLITTIDGLVPIRNIEPGMLVLTSKGFKPVLKRFNNGMRQVFNYSLQIDTNEVNLVSTNTHKIKTTLGWKEIQKLEQGFTLYQHKSSMEKHITCTREKSIIVKELQDYIEKFGNIIMEQYQKDITYITLMEIAQIIESKISILLKQNYILDLKVKSDLKTIQILQKSFTQKELKQQKSGISQMKEENGIKNTEKNLGLIENIEHLFVKFVQKNIQLDIQEFPNTAIKTVKLQHFEQGESWMEEVYDIMVDECHEYFANGILVHNCIDAVRYIAMQKLKHNSDSKLISF
jgi:phage terminase large subunit